MPDKPKRVRKRQPQSKSPSQAPSPPIANTLAKLLSGIPLKSRGKAIQALRERIAENPDTETMWKTIWDFDLQRAAVQNNDRSLVLTLGAILERGLEIAILTHCIPMSDEEEKRFFGPPDGAPITFDVKIRLGFALGLYGTVSRDDLVIIRHIRNLFAHAKTNLTFLSQEITDVCDHFQWIDLMKWGGIMGNKPLAARQKFIESVRHYYVFLASAGKPGEPLRYTSYDLPELYS